MFQSRIGDTKTGGLNVGYRINEKTSAGNLLAANIDNVKKLNAYTARQRFTFLFEEKGQLELIAGAGMEQTTAALLGNANPTQVGTTFGYNFQWNDEHWAIVSMVGLNSNSFPGYI